MLALRAVSFVQKDEAWLKMNLRILKKLSKRAAPLLLALGDTRQQFKCERDDGELGYIINARKHWQRRRSKDNTRWDGTPWDDRIIKPAADGNGFIHIYSPSSPRKGTINVGRMSGYYEPEWSDTPAWYALKEFVESEFMDFDNWNESESSWPTITRDLSTPSKVFAAAHDILRAREIERMMKCAQSK